MVGYSKGQISEENNNYYRSLEIGSRTGGKCHREGFNLIF